MTGTAPNLKSANAEAISGRPGLTITSVLSPLRRPCAANRPHHASASAASSANVSER